MTTDSISCLAYFNPRSHEGSDELSFGVNITQDISIHAPTKGATQWQQPGWSMRRDFNPRSHEGSDNIPLIGRAESADFNPRSHEGSDGGFDWDLMIYEISIHAPTKGATKAMMDNFGISGISIHAPTKGATSCFSFSIT